MTSYSGGCQCGAVRYSVAGFGRASICHCRMCQKAFGNAFAPLVTAKGLNWTRGVPKYFQSSNKVKRGFCADCGTPLTYEFEGFGPEIAICTLDDPSVAPPVIQVGTEGRLPWCEAISEMPARTSEEDGAAEELYATLVSHQHPDHDTDSWPDQEAGDKD
ncbi:GFA family protein [Roseibium sp.]|uniref:GFA family protein n=1 Tax=Roseibium sp. TaxID=1936156 RepID=UPI003A97E76F